MLNKRSLIRLMAVMQATDVEFNSMLTLTYPKQFPRDGTIVKKDLNALLQKLRRSNMGEYLWFLEFQTRGAPHIHLLLETESITPKLRTDFAFFWTGRISQSDWFLGSFDSEDDYHRDVLNSLKVTCDLRAWSKLRTTHGAKHYVMAYAGKERQKTVPKAYKSVGRFWGASRAVTPESHIVDVIEQEVIEFIENHGYDCATWSTIPKWFWPTPARNESV